MSKITKHWDDAGSRPGQRQDLTIEFVSRKGNKVKIKWELKVRSNGTDMYDYHTRHNSARIYSPKDNRRSSQSYQAKGHKDHASVSDSFTMEVENETSKIDFWYKNKRVWVKHTDAYEPRSTGVVDKTKVGTLEIPKNVKHTIKFDWVISDTVKEYKVWDQNSFTIPNLSPNSKYYDFKGWTTKKYDNKLSEIKKAKVDVKAGKKIDSVENNITYYAVWRPKTIVYCFYDKGSRAGNPSYRIKHTYGTPTKMPDGDNVPTSIIKNSTKYRVPGYTFKHWVLYRNDAGAIRSKTYKPGSKCSEWPTKGLNYVVFIPQRDPDPNTIEFLFKNPNDDKRVFSKGDSGEAYYTDSKFNMSKALTNSSGEKKFTDITAWPGYKLVGWSTTPLTIAMPGKSLSIGKHSSSADEKASKAFTIYPTSGTIDKFDYSYFSKHKLTLYGYYEYYTTTYVYTKDGWKLAMPYVYTKDGWKMALSYVYTKDGWKI